MLKGTEIKSNIDNLKYYVDEIEKLVKEQYELDSKRADEIGVNVNPGTLRFDALAVIVMDCGLFKTYIQNMETNLKTAISQDKLLFDFSEDETVKESK